MVQSGSTCSTPRHWVKKWLSGTEKQKMRAQWISKWLICVSYKLLQTRTDDVRRLIFLLNFPPSRTEFRNTVTKTNIVIGPGEMGDWYWSWWEYLSSTCTGIFSITHYKPDSFDWSNRRLLSWMLGFLILIAEDSLAPWEKYWKKKKCWVESLTSTPRINTPKRRVYTAPHTLGGGVLWRQRISSEGGKSWSPRGASLTRRDEFSGVTLGSVLIGPLEVDQKREKMRNASPIDRKGTEQRGPSLWGWQWLQESAKEARATGKMQDTAGVESRHLSLLWDFEDENRWHFYSGTCLFLILHVLEKEKGQKNYLTLEMSVQILTMFPDQFAEIPEFL